MGFVIDKWVHKNMKKIIFGLVSLLILSSATFYAFRNTNYTHFIPFTEKNTVVFGRYEHTKEGIAFSQSGTQLNFATNASQIEVQINNKLQFDSSNWFTILLDNKFYGTVILKSGTHFYPVEFPASDSMNIVSFVKCTESFVGEVVFNGIKIAKDAHLKDGLNGSFKNMYHIQFIGNSITCGYGNMVSISPPQGNPNTGFFPLNENAFDGYAIKTARNLNAIPMLVSYTGIGLCRNFNGDTVETMPKIYNRIHLQKKESLFWDHKLQIPNLIVINLGTNDYSGESKNMPMDDAVFVQTYIDFVERLIKMYPKAKIICSNGSMMSDDWPSGKKCWTRIQKNIKQVESQFNTAENKKVYSFFFKQQEPPYGDNFHPSSATHTKMAEELSTFIKTEVIK